MAKRTKPMLHGDLEEHQDNAFHLAENVLHFTESAERKIKQKECGQAVLSLQDAYGFYGSMEANLASAGLDDSDWPENARNAFVELVGVQSDFSSKCLIGGGLSGMRRRRKSR